MRRLLLLFAMILSIMAGLAQNKSGSIREGKSFVDLTFNASDTIIKSETYYVEITSFQNFPSMQDVYIHIDKVSGDPNIEVNVYGKLTSGSTYATICDAVTWTATSADTTIVMSNTSPVRYRYFKVEFVSTATTQKSLIYDVQFKQWFSGGAVSGSTITDGTATLTAGNLSGVKTLTLENGLTIDNATDNVLEFNENSDELKWTFGSNTVTASSTDVTTFDYGTINLATDALDLSEGDISNVGSISMEGVLENGELSTARTVALTDNYIGNVTNLVSASNPGSSYTLMGGYFKAANTTEDQPNTQLVGLASCVNMGMNITDAYAFQSHIGTGAEMETGVSHANIAAISGKVDLDHNITQGNVQAGLFIIEATGGATVTEESNIIQATVENGSVASNGIALTGSGTVTDGLDVGISNMTNGVKIGSCTTDIYLQNGETLNNALDKNIITNASVIKQCPSPSAINSTDNITAAQMLGGVITSTSGAATSLTTPTATAIMALIPGGGRGTTFDLVIDNSAGSSTVTLVLDASISVNTPAITGGDALTVSAANTVALFRFYFVSGTAAKVFRIY